MNAGPHGSDVRGEHELVVVANRLPVDRRVQPDGSVVWLPSPGGLVAALEPVMRSNSGAWVGWTGDENDSLDPFEVDGLHLVPVPLDAEDVEHFYEGMSNATLWPLYHDVIVAPKFHRHWWDAYVDVNRRFAQSAALQAAPGARVWVQDYQLQLVPQLVRQLRPDVRIGFFNHIPFPPYEIFAQLPWRRQVLDGLLGADLLGFQRPADANNFQRACRRNGLVTRRNQVRVGAGHLPGGRPGDPEREVRSASFPISVDAERLDRVARRPQVQERARQIRRELGDPDVVLLGVDRLDYTKGILHRLEAVGELFDAEELRTPGTVLVQVATPSRERVDQYRRMRDAVEVTVSRINGDHGRIGRPAVHYLHHSYPREELAALYLAADVLLVTALRDGMNLVAKEYVATRHDERGALVLSEFAGAAIELPQALLVNPHDIDGLKAAIMQAVHLSPREAARRMRVMRRRVFQHDVRHWAQTFLTALDDQVATVRRPAARGAQQPEPIELPVAPAPVVLPADDVQPAMRAAAGREPVGVGAVTAAPSSAVPGSAPGAEGAGPVMRRPRLVTPELSVEVVQGPAADSGGGPGGPLPDSWARPAGGRALPAGLRSALARFAEHTTVLVGLDFDGVLAPIVTDPDTARALPGSARALERLAGIPGVRVALLSGRALADLARVAQPPDGIRLVGSHGVEYGPGPAGAPASPTLDEPQAALLGKVSDALFAVSRNHPGTRVEVKPAAAVLHTRRARRADAERATAEALAGPARWPGVHLTHGKEVVELSVLPADKGVALRRLRAEYRSEVVLYAGDDVTDERAFAVLEDDAGDVTVKVGAGESLARHRLRGPEEVTRLLEHLVTLLAEQG